MQQPIDQNNACAFCLASNDIDHIDVICRKAHIHLTQTEDADIRLSWKNAGEMPVYMEHQDRRLTLTETEPVGMMGLLETLFPLPPAQLFIGIPENYAGTLELETSTGNITMESVDTVGRADLHSMSGDMEIHNVYTSGGFSVEGGEGQVTIHNLASSGKLWIASKSGVIEANQVTTDASCTMYAQSGNCDVNTLLVSGHLAVEGGSSMIHMTNVQARSVNAMMSAPGEIRMRKLSVAESIKIHSGSGDIFCNIDDDINQYTAYCYTGAATCDIPDISGNGPKRLHIRTNSGHIQVNFDGKPSLAEAA